jgi:hypothetical protein
VEIRVGGESRYFLYDAISDALAGMAPKEARTAMAKVTGNHVGSNVSLLYPVHGPKLCGVPPSNSLSIKLWTRVVARKQSTVTGHPARLPEPVLEHPASR